MVKLWRRGPQDELRRQLSGDRLMEITVDRPVRYPQEKLEASFPELIIESIEDCSIRYRSKDPYEHNPQIVRFLAGLGMGTVLLHEITPTLEEIYLSIVKEDNELA